MMAALKAILYGAIEATRANAELYHRALIASKTTTSTHCAVIPNTSPVCPPICFFAKTATKKMVAAVMAVTPAPCAIPSKPIAPTKAIPRAANACPAPGRPAITERPSGRATRSATITSPIDARDNAPDTNSAVITIDTSDKFAIAKTRSAREKNIAATP
jgi:hypothetical protein